ncbi:hypothetical protein J4410_00370, partial [Candidatus Woesearchaeota archaeon]|nr:hypothetical protein [Candidatus Woesearchaeota archaeon]
KRTNEEDISKLSGGEKADRDVVVRRMIMLYATAKRVDQALAQQKKDGQDVSWTFDALEGVLKSTLGLPESELETAYKTNMDYLGSQKEVENTEYLKAIGKIEAAITALGGVQDQSTKKARYQKAQAAVREFVDQHGANPREGEENIWYANTLQSFMNANFDEFTLTEQREKKYAEDLARLQNEVRGLERFKTSEGKKGAYAALQQVVTEFKEAHGTLPRAKKTDVSFIDDPLQYLLDTSYQGFIANEQRTATGLIITNTDGTPQDPRTLAQSSTNDALASLDSRISELIEERTRRLQNSDLVQVEHTVRYLTDRIAELKAEHGKHSASDVAIIKAMQAYKPIAVGEYARLRYQKPKTGTVIAEHLVAKSKEGLWTNITSEAYNVIKYGSGFAALDEIVRGTGRGLEKIKPKKGMFGLAYKLGSFGCQTLYLPISVAKWAGDFVSKLLPYNEKTFGPKHIDTKTLDGQAELVKRTGKHLLLPTDVFFLPAGTPAGTLVRLLWWAGKNSLEAVMGTDDQTAARA